jgi:hypothetical protein
MRTYKGNEMAPAGLYWNRREWTLNIVKGPADRLPGDDTGRFWRLPAAALLLVAPVMGLGFILFLPLAGFLLLGELILEKAGPLVQSVIRHAHVPRRARPGVPPVR